VGALIRGFVVAAIALVTSLLLTHPAAEASPASPRTVGGTGAVCALVGAAAESLGQGCDKVTGAAGAVTPIGLATKGADKALEATGLKDKAAEVLHQYTPQGILEEWATGFARGSASMLADLQDLMLSATKPDLKQDWWSTQYAATWGIGCVCMAFALLAASRSMSRGGPEAKMYAEEVTTRALFYMPAMLILPPLITLGVDAANLMASWFGDEGSKSAETAIEAYIQMLSQVEDTDTVVSGGTLGLIVFAGATFISAFFAMAVLTAANYGVYTLALVLPILYGISVHPAWKTWATRGLGVLAGVILTPTILFFGFWVMWGGAEGLAENTDSTLGRVSLMLFVAAAAGVATIAPVLLGFLMPLLVGHGDTPMGRRAASSAARKGARIGAAVGTGGVSSAGQVASRMFRGGPNPNRAHRPAPTPPEPRDGESAKPTQQRPTQGPPNRQSGQNAPSPSKPGERPQGPRPTPQKEPSPSAPRRPDLPPTHSEPGRRRRDI
jgi:hypothetical protein